MAVHDEPIEEPPLLELKAVVVNGSVAVEDDDEDEKGINELESAWNRIKKLDRTEMTEIPSEVLLPAEKPSVSSRFSHRKPPKANLEGIISFLICLNSCFFKIN